MTEAEALKDIVVQAEARGVDITEEQARKVLLAFLDRMSRSFLEGEGIEKPVGLISDQDLILEFDKIK